MKTADELLTQVNAFLDALPYEVALRTYPLCLVDGWQAHSPRIDASGLQSLQGRY